MTDSNTSGELLALTAEIVAAHVANNRVEQADLPELIRKVHAALAGIGGSTASGPKSLPRPEPAVPVKKSITPDFIICLEDGRKLKMLKRHLRTSYNLTPEQYRERWDLPSDYPMVAANYAAKRAQLAKKIGLGTGRRKARR
jgi:predicted transcriptional regulator